MALLSRFSSLRGDSFSDGGPNHVAHSDSQEVGHLSHTPELGTGYPEELDTEVNHAPNEVALHNAPKFSVVSSSMNSIILLMGLATLSSPYALAQSGILGIGSCIVVAGLYGHSTSLMFKAMNLSDTRSYMEMARCAFPNKGHQIASWLFYLETAGTLVGFFISIGDMFHAALPHFHMRLISSRVVPMLGSLAIILPMVWAKDLRVISRFSSICNLALIAIMGCVLYTGITSTGFHHVPPVVRWKGILDAFGIFSFAFGATPVFPTLYATAGRASPFKKVVFASFGAAVILYIGLGLAGAFMFGLGTRSLITTNLPHTLPAAKISNWLGVLIPITKFPILIAPVFKELDEYITARLLNIICRSLITSILLVIAIFFPYFSRVIELVGLSLTILLCNILPNIFYLRICGDRTHKRHKIAIYFSTAIGIIISIAGTTANIIRTI